MTLPGSHCDRKARIGFMQGRLSPVIDARIQAFPRDHWQDEFASAASVGFEIMEWTLDQDGLNENPLLTKGGRDEIRGLCAIHKIRIPSLTGDCFMQAPFWKANGPAHDSLETQFHAVIEACHELRIEVIIVPLVDHGAIENAEQEVSLLDFMSRNAERFAHLGITIAFESDYPPQRVLQLVDQLPKSAFGINYDIGNSAALGFDPAEEIALYGHRIRNVHIKDRLLGGITVALGEGAANLPHVLQLLVENGYTGNYILQTARAENGDDVGRLCHYRDMTRAWLEHDES